MCYVIFFVGTGKIQLSGFTESRKPWHLHIACTVYKDMHVHTDGFLATPHQPDETGFEAESYTRLHLHMPIWGEGRFTV